MPWGKYILKLLIQGLDKSPIFALTDNLIESCIDYVCQLPISVPLNSPMKSDTLNVPVCVKMLIAG